MNHVEVADMYQGQEKADADMNSLKRSVDDMRNDATLFSQFTADTFNRVQDLLNEAVKIKGYLAESMVNSVDVFDSPSIQCGLDANNCPKARSKLCRDPQLPLMRQPCYRGLRHR